MIEHKIVSEYGYIYYKEQIVLNNKFIHAKITKSQWDELYDYWKTNDNAKKVLEFDGYNLKATNYVGVVQTKNLIIEILPKIYDGKEDKKKTRNIFIEMLKPLLNINEVQIDKANLSTTENKNIYEIFIALFIESIDKLIHKGLRSQYISREDNQYFLKGKLKFNEHIKKNYIHKERFYVEFDEYLQDRVENRLLKSTISLLLKKTKDSENKKALRQQLFIFDEVELSRNHKIDIDKINIHRGMEHYTLPLRFAKVFLLHESFSSMRGNDNVFALLFPMEKVFENYMEFILKNSKDILGIKKVLVNGGKNEYLLKSGNCQMARLQPDYLLKMKEGKDIVTDAKWKLLKLKENDSKNCETINISSDDVYQIFSYLHFYDCRDTAYLFVPQTEIKKEIELKYQINNQDRDLKIKIIPINLKKLIESHKLEDNILGENFEPKK